MKKQPSTKKKGGCLTTFLVLFFALTLIGSCSGGNDADSTEPTISSTATTEITQPTEALVASTASTETSPTESNSEILPSTEATQPTVGTTATEETQVTTEATTEPAEVHTYVLNTNTKKFHIMSCSSADDIKEGNKDTVTCTREEVIAMGYEPCGRCKP